MRDEEKTDIHVKLRCTQCGAKFDSKYDKIPLIGTYRVGEVYQSLMHCEKCKRRVDVKVIQVR